MKTISVQGSGFGLSVYADAGYASKATVRLSVRLLQHFSETLFL